MLAEQVSALVAEVAEIKADIRYLKSLLAAHLGINP